MNLISVMDDINAHAIASAAAVDPLFVDVAVGYRVGKGRCVRTYYAGEVDPPPRLGAEHVLDADLVGERVVVSALFPIADISKEKGREQLGQAWTFKHELRTRVLGDAQLGGDAVDLLLLPTTVEEVLISKQSYLECRTEIQLSYTEYAIAV